MPKFSIVIPVYNVAPYLRECLDSVLAQTFADWECLCVDDGSTDESGAILAEYAQKDPRFRVFHKKNGGVSSARNLGLDNAKGEWIAFLDGDDVWHVMTLEILQAILDRFDDAEIVRFTSCGFIDGDAIQWPLITSNDELPSVTVLNTECLITGNEGLYTFANRIYKRGLIEEIRFAKLMVGEDLLFLTQALLESRQQHCINCCFYAYRHRQGSAVHSKVSKRKVLDEMFFTLKVLQLFAQASKKIDKRVIRMYLNKFVETNYVMIAQLPRQESEECFRIWLDGLRKIREMGVASRFQKLRIEILTRIPSFGFTFSLSYLPYWFKKNGIHR